MSLFLVQHGKCLPKDIDPERSLSKEGIKEVKRIANVAKSYGVHISRIRHSGKKRSIQTAEIIASVLSLENVSKSSGLNPLDNVMDIADTLNADNDEMLVGHLPFMENLTAYLTTGDTEYTVFKFQNGGIVCLNKNPADRFWFIQWALMPNIE